MFEYNIPMLEKIATDISVLMGISIAILDNELNALVSSKTNGDYCEALQSLHQWEKCFHCDMDLLAKCKYSKKTERHLCHAGLCDSAMPIIKNETIVGYILLGRIRSDLSPKKQKYGNIEYNGVTLDALYNKLPYFTETQFECLYDLMPRILLENAIVIKEDTIIDRATKYIDDNLNKSICLTDICKELNASKNAVYKSFRSSLGKTVNEYVLDKKLNLAKKLLTETNNPVYDIAEKVGINNYTYFCKLFKKKIGKTPIEFRKTNQ